MSGTVNGPQGTFDGMPAPLYKATPTRMLAWLDCPRRYRLAYLDEPRPAKRAARAHTNVGIAIHNALRDWWDLAERDRTPDAGARLVDESWVDLGFRDAGQSARARASARSAVAAYLESTAPPDEPRWRERNVSCITGPLLFFGRLDRLDERADGELVVVDYKTGRRPPDEDDARTSLALAMYAAAVWKTLKRRCVTVELHHVPSGTVARHVHTDESLTRRVGEATSIVRDLIRADADHAAHGSASREFEPRPGPLCSWCDFRAHCPEGQAMGPEQPDWAGLPDEVL